MKSSRVFSFITMLMILLGLSITVSAGYAQNPVFASNTAYMFYDVQDGYWAKDQIEYFAQKGIVSGYTDGSFRPEAGVTREEFCKLLISAFGQPLELPSTPTFADVSEDRWSYGYVEACKDFLTAYANPFGGMPSFHPEEYATREDIAVALVRMMGYTADDAKNEYYAFLNFKDGGDISPNLLAYVSIACEKGLISGYPDGSFAPSMSITRAETVSLLNRATKQAVTDINAELEMSAAVRYSDDGKTATVNIIAESGTNVTVNGQKVMMSNNYFGQYEGNYVYKFESEGSVNFTVHGERLGKTKTVNLTAKYETSAPVLTISECPATTNNKIVSISGTAYDEHNGITVIVNGVSVNSRSTAGTLYWYETCTLTRGENIFNITVTNTEGKVTTETKTIIYDVDAPELEVYSMKTITNQPNIRISGSAYDKNYGFSVSINGTVIADKSYSGYELWEANFPLNEGENTFIIEVKSQSGKSVTETRTVTYNMGLPTLKIDEIPLTTNSKEITISGTAYDENYKVTVSINGEDIKSANYGTLFWSKNVTLNEGQNTFEIVARNTEGKKASQTITITCNVLTPQIQFYNCPEQTQNSMVTIKGKINNASMLFINDKEKYVGADGQFTLDVTLNEGVNIFTFRVVNEYGKSVTQTKTITYTPLVIDENIEDSQNQGDITENESDKLTTEPIL